MVESGPGTPVLVSSAARALHVPRDCISVRRLNLTTLITGPDRPAVRSWTELAAHERTPGGPPKRAAYGAPPRPLGASDTGLSRDKYCEGGECVG